MPLLTAILLSLAASLAQGTTCLSSTYSQSYKKLQDRVIKTLPASNIASCMEQCAFYTDCCSINYHNGDGICELNNANHVTYPGGLVFSVGYQYMLYNRSTIFLPSSTCKGREQAVLFFPREGIEDKVLLENPFESLNAFTVSVWAKPVIKSYQSLFSYAISASKNVGNEIFIDIVRSKMRIYLAEKLVTSSIPTPYSDGKWHHYCVTWENTQGKWIGYVDGVKEEEGVINIGHVITKGALILGQDQDSYKGGFVDFQAFQGHLTNVNMWNKALTPQEVSDLAKSCHKGMGNIVTWSDLAIRGEGKVKLLCNSAPCT